MKTGFSPIKEAEKVNYSGYFIVPGVWVNGEEKPIKCWASFTPDKKYLGCYVKFLDAKEKIKTHRISKFLIKK